MLSLPLNINVDKNLNLECIYLKNIRTINEIPAAKLETSLMEKNINTIYRLIFEKISTDKAGKCFVH